MMAQTLQGKVLRQSCGQSSMQQLSSQSDLKILRLWDLDPDTSVVRHIVRNKIVLYLKDREGFCNWELDHLEKFSRTLDEQLFKEAESQIHYLDLSTINARVDALLSSRPVDDNINTWLSLATSSTLNSELLPNLEVPASRTNHAKVAPRSTNPSSCGTNSSTHLPLNDSSSTSQRYLPNEHHRIAANFALTSSDRVMHEPENLTNTVIAPCAPALPKCTTGLGGSPSGGVHNGHIKDHFPGDAHQIDGWQASVSGSSSTLSATFSPTTNSSAMRTISTGSVSTTNTLKFSTSTKAYSLGQGPSSPQDEQCKKELEYLRSQPLEQSDQSDITTGSHQYRWEHDMLYLYDHTMKCPYLKGECGLVSCVRMKQKLCHILHCKDSCRDDCSNLNKLFIHYRSCFVMDCDTCSPVRERVQKATEQRSNCTVSKPTSPTSDKSVGKHRPLKRIKVDCPNLDHINEIKSPEIQQPVVNDTRQPAEVVQSEFGEIPMKSSSCSSLGENHVGTNNEFEVATEVVPNEENVRSSETAVQTEEELRHEDRDIEMKDSKVDSSSAFISSSIGAKLGGRKKKGASILYAFTAEELRDHIKSLKQHTCPSNVTTEEHQLVEGLPDQNTCSLCGMERLLFEPPPRFCALCFKIINPTGCYYVEVENGNDKASVCSRCHNIGNGKAKYEKRFNYAETDAEAEWWVECDKCKAWQHQICALFNPKIVEAEAEYTCAKCFLKEKESRESDLLESRTVLGAQELPRTTLSDHIEQRLSSRLEQDWRQRASTSGKSIEEVPGVEGLTVRVVSSAARVLQVQPRFQEFFKQEKYPEEFPYKSKAILLFQKIEGVDVCLFAMYVQEYGSDCPLPNQRHIYLAYIDSVKYFRPDIKAASGEALRTFVYHEILIGYLDYCKKRGFVSCSIWACPSTKHDDYVLYCHPTTQKMPKSDKLRGWYQNLVKKAVKESVVVERNTLYDFFLQPTNECKANISAACLPYCENDFWPGEAERLLEKKDENTSHKKETQVGRLLRVAKRDDRKGNLEDILLVHRLGERMRTMKEDFIMLCLQQFCKHCHHPIVSGKSWVCTSCKNFHLCDQCHSEEENSPQKDRHPATSKQKHIFQRIEENPLPETDDGDPKIQSKYFDSRTDFLKHCQDNLYQFDTLRRAKHSTMMILYHLHASACSSCHRGMDQSSAWRCPTCQGCNFCDSCYKRDGEALHVHQLIQTASTPDCHKQQNKGKEATRAVQQVYLDALVHASRCLDPRSCTSRTCILMKKLFHHGVQCKVRVHHQGGCFKCLFMWKLLLTHSKACEQLDCRVPRCRDIREYMANRNKLSGS